METFLGTLPEVCYCAGGGPQICKSHKGQAEDGEARRRGTGVGGGTGHWPGLSLRSAGERRPFWRAVLAQAVGQSSGPWEEKGLKCGPDHIWCRLASGHQEVSQPFTRNRKGTWGLECGLLQVSPCWVWPTFCVVGSSAVDFSQSTSAREFLTWAQGTWPFWSRESSQIPALGRWLLWNRQTSTACEPHTAGAEPSRRERQPVLHLS